jgi:hypothetical protein
MVPVHPPRRLLRSGVAASVAGALGVSGHVMAGGSIRFWAVVGAGAVAAAVVWVCAGRERDTWTIAALQVRLQLFVHTVLATGAVPAVGGVVPHDLMLHAHVVAGLLTAVVLRAGERRTWAAARRIAARIASWCLRVTGGPMRRSAGPVFAPAPALRVVARHRLLRHTLVLRGPPTAAA